MVNVAKHTIHGCYGNIIYFLSPMYCGSRFGNSKTSQKRTMLLEVVLKKIGRPTLNTTTPPKKTRSPRFEWFFFGFAKWYEVLPLSLHDTYRCHFLVPYQGCGLVASCLWYCTTPRLQHGWSKKGGRSHTFFKGNYPPEKWHDNGKPTIWRCISYKKLSSDFPTIVICSFFGGV